eukprot:scaffold7654_cov109-Isochrysis_galbana.AAC.2
MQGRARRCVQKLCRHRSLLPLPEPDRLLCPATQRAVGTAHKIRAIIHARERSGASHPQRLLNRSNRTIGPLFSLDATGTLSMTEHMAKRLDA